MPYCIGLQRAQLKDLERRSKKTSCPKSSFIQYAIMRWKRGDFQIPDEDPKERDIVPLTIWKKLDLKDWQIRCILKKHFEIPDQKIKAELDRQNKICKGMLKLYSEKKFVFENKEDEAYYNERKEN